MVSPGLLSCVSSLSNYVLTEKIASESSADLFEVNLIDDCVMLIFKICKNRVHLQLHLDY